MSDTISGIPLHPLVVHGVVVLLPLAILGTIAVAARPRWRTPYGFLVVAAASIATILVPVSTSSGESLEERVGDPGEHAELTGIYQAKGLSPSTALLVATELTAHDALAAHADAELRIDPDELTNAWHASLASAIAFTLGAILPLVAILLAPAAWRVPVTVLSVLSALALTGVLSSRIGGSRARVAVVRIVVGGAAGLALTYAIGRLFGSAVG